jgi:hypothetical protein
MTVIGWTPLDANLPVKQTDRECFVVKGLTVNVHNFEAVVTVVQDATSTGRPCTWTSRRHLFWTGWRSTTDSTDTDFPHRDTGRVAVQTVGSFGYWVPTYSVPTYWLPVVWTTASPATGTCPKPNS